MNFLECFNDIECDMWQKLSDTKEPIVLYGMGDGAEKILDILDAKNIPVAGIFASDGFVPKKKKLFRGFEIESYSDIKRRLGNMTVLVSFGTKLSDVIENIIKISRENTLFAPDVPVFGSGILDMEYFKENLSRFENVYSVLSDDISRKAYINCLKFRLTGDISYLSECETDADESYRNIIKPRPDSTYIDIGAYNGDTIREFSSYSTEKITVHAIEPDIRNFKKLSAYAENCGIKEIHLHNAAAWDKNEIITFFSRSGRNSANTTSHKNAKANEVSGICADSIAQKADFIKIDAEGADIPALSGCKRLIRECSPALCVAAYHRTEDYFAIPEFVFSQNSSYQLYFRHFPHIPCWDTNFYFKPKNV